MTQHSALTPNGAGLKASYCWLFPNTDQHTVQLKLTRQQIVRWCVRIAHSRCAFVSHHEIVCVCCSVHGEGHCVYGVCMGRSTGSVESVSLNVYAIFEPEYVLW